MVLEAERRPETAVAVSNDTDPDPGDILTITALAHGNLAGALTIAPDGQTIQFDPDAATSVQALAQGEIGTFSFQYTVADIDGATATATTTVAVRGIDGSPEAVEVLGSNDLLSEADFVFL